MKRIFLLLFALLTALSLSSCRVTDLLGDFITYRDPDIDIGTEDRELYLTVIPDTLRFSEGYAPVTSSCAYDALPLEGERELYTKLLAAYYDISPEPSDEAGGRYPMPQVELSGYSLTEAQIRTVLSAVYNDRPEIFWPSGTMGFYSGEDSTVVQVYSVFSPEEVDQRLNAVYDAAAAFYETVPDGLTAYQRERLAHDYLIDRAAYAADVDKENPQNNDHDIYTAYGALVEGEAVCEGYAKAFQLLMNGLGVDCVCVTGRAGEELHMWNAVRLDGGWYGVDPTWDDRDELYLRYAYFNLTDALMGRDHTPFPLFTELDDGEINGENGDINADTMNCFIPSCTDDSMTYYYQETVHLSDYDGADLKNALYAAADRQDQYFLFYVDRALDFDDTAAALFADYPQYFFSYLSAVNGYLEGYSVDESNIGYRLYPELRLIVAELKYY